MSAIYDINETNFLTDVIDASQQVPVLVDFWASWCEPCKNLIPILEKLNTEYAGKFRFAKIDVDQQQQLTTQFAIRSVPTVKMVVKGEFVDEFTGVLTEQQIREFIDKHLAQNGDPTNLSPLEQALRTYQNGDAKNALEQMQQVLLDEPANPMVRIEFANILMREKRFDDAKDLLQSLPDENKNDPMVLSLFGQLEAIETVIESPDLDSLLQAIEQDPNNHLAREQLSAHYQLRGDYIAAMDQLLEIVRRDRKYNDDAGRTGLLKLFEQLGNQNEIVGLYRRKLAQLLN